MEKTLQEIQKEIQEFWPDWTLTNELGQGGGGTVYRAERTEFGSVFTSAVKVISIPQDALQTKELLNEGMDTQSIAALYREQVSSCVNEIRVMERLKGNGHIVGIQDFKVTERPDILQWQIFIRMELLTALPDYLAENEVTAETVYRLGQDLCSALETCEEERLIHRDIKPENVFYSRKGGFKLGDFGIAKILEKTTSMHTRTGTTNYMAPEVFFGRKYGATVDTYSLGLLMYILCNKNRIPFLDTEKSFNTFSEREEASFRRLHGEMLPDPCNAEGRLKDIILKACSYRPEDRYLSAADMRKDLFAAAGADKEDKEELMPADGHRITKSRHIPSERKEKKTTGRNHGLPVLLGILLGIIVVFGIILYGIGHGNYTPEVYQVPESDESVMSVAANFEGEVTEDSNAEELGGTVDSISSTEDLADLAGSSISEITTEEDESEEETVSGHWGLQAENTQRMAYKAVLNVYEKEWKMTPYRKYAWLLTAPEISKSDGYRLLYREEDVNEDGNNELLIAVSEDSSESVYCFAAYQFDDEVLKAQRILTEEDFSYRYSEDIAAWHEIKSGTLADIKAEKMFNDEQNTLQEIREGRQKILFASQVLGVEQDTEKCLLVTLPQGAVSETDEYQLCFTMRGLHEEWIEYSYGYTAMSSEDWSGLENTGYLKGGNDYADYLYSESRSKEIDNREIDVYIWEDEPEALQYGYTRNEAYPDESAAVYLTILANGVDDAAADLIDQAIGYCSFLDDGTVYDETKYGSISVAECFDGKYAAKSDEKKYELLAFDEDEEFAFYEKLERGGGTLEAYLGRLQFRDNSVLNYQGEQLNAQEFLLTEEEPGDEFIFQIGERQYGEIVFQWDIQRMENSKPVLLQRVDGKCSGIYYALRVFFPENMDYYGEPLSRYQISDNNIETDKESAKTTEEKTEGKETESVETEEELTELTKAEGEKTEKEKTVQDSGQTVDDDLEMQRGMLNAPDAIADKVEETEKTASGKDEINEISGVPFQPGSFELGVYRNESLGLEIELGDEWIFTGFKELWEGWEQDMPELFESAFAFEYAENTTGTTGVGIGIMPGYMTPFQEFEEKVTVYVSGKNMQGATSVGWYNERADSQTLKFWYSVRDYKIVISLQAMGKESDEEMQTLIDGITLADWVEETAA